MNPRGQMTRVLGDIVEFAQPHLYARIAASIRTPPRQTTMRYNNQICTLDHTGDLPQALLEALPENQGHPVRHRCAACAYLAGMNEAAADIRFLVARVAELERENEALKGRSG